MRKLITSRKAMIIITVILGILMILYLGGLFGQLNFSYQNWLNHDGLSGNALMSPVDFRPGVCISYAFTKAGYSSTLLVMLVMVGFFLYIKYHDWFSSHDLDDRKFTRSKNGTYGTAGWMSDKEMREVLDISSPDKATGTILGEKNGSVIALPENTKLNKHLFICGASGTMKSRAIIRNHLFQSIKRGESVIITDPKSELYTDSAELFLQNGYHVKVFNLVDPVHSDSWNCMADLHGDTLMAQVLTDVIIANTSGEKGDHFWDNGEGNLLKSLVLYVDQDNSRGPEEKHLPAVYQLLSQYSEKQLSVMFDRLPVSHPAKAPYSLFKQASDTVRAGIILGLGTRLQVMQNEAVRAITSSSDIDLTLPGKTKCAYFVILSDQEGALDFLSSLFFSFLFIKLVRYADSAPDGRCNVPVNLIFDELNNVGTIPDYPRRLSTIRSRALQVCMAVQNLAQLQNRYPDNEWAELVGNCDTQVMLGCTDEISAEFFSMRSGDMTIEVNSTMTVKQSIAIAQLIPQYRHTEGEGKRRLLTPDEVLRLPSDELLIIIRGQKVLKAKKFDYTGHPFAKNLVRSLISDYVSQHNPPLPQTTIKYPEETTLKTQTSPKLYMTATPPDEF